MTNADKHGPPEHRYSLQSLLALTTVCCVIAAIAARFPSAIPIIVPPIIGPFVAWSIVPSWRAQALGLVAAYFWTIALQFTIGLPLIFTIDGKDSPNGYAIACLASLASMLGGYLGAMMERSRLKHQVRQRIRRQRKQLPLPQTKS